MANNDQYFKMPGVSNSDLSKLKEMLHPSEKEIDPTNAYKFGTLIDAVITEPEHVDYYNLRCHGEQYAEDDFAMAKRMKEAFLNDPDCRKLVASATFQKVDHAVKDFNVDGLKFQLPAKCKWDLWFPTFKFGGDIKSTTATTQKQFVDACYHFDYDRQRAWYMNIPGAKNDILIGISKVNMKVFKLPISHGDGFHSSGIQKMNAMAKNYFILLHDLKIK